MPKNGESPDERGFMRKLNPRVVGREFCAVRQQDDVYIYMHMYISIFIFACICIHVYLHVYPWGKLWSSSHINKNKDIHLHVYEFTLAPERKGVKLSMYRVSATWIL